VTGTLKGLMSAGGISNAVANMPDHLASSAIDLSSKSFWSRVEVHNKTQFPLRYRMDRYFHAGEFWHPPTDISAFSVGEFSICAKGGSWSDLSGATMFYLDMGDDFCTCLGIGFSYSVCGVAKSSVWVSYTTLSQCSMLGSTILALTYNSLSRDPMGRFTQCSGVDLEGRKSTICLTARAVPRQNTIITIFEKVVQTSEAANNEGHHQRNGMLV